MIELTDLQHEVAYSMKTMNNERAVGQLAYIDWTRTYRMKAELLQCSDH